MTPPASIMIGMVVVLVMMVCSVHSAGGDHYGKMKIFEDIQGNFILTASPGTPPYQKCAG